MKKDLMVIMPSVGKGKCPECQGKMGSCSCEEDEISMDDDSEEDDLGIMPSESEEEDDLEDEVSLDDMMEGLDSEESEDTIESSIFQSVKDEDPIGFEIELKKLFDKWYKEQK